MCPSSKPSAHALRQLLADAEPEISTILERWKIFGDEAEDLIAGVLVGVSYRWERIRNPRDWVLRAVEKDARRRDAANRKESEHG